MDETTERDDWAQAQGGRPAEGGEAAAEGTGVQVVSADRQACTAAGKRFAGAGRQADAAVGEAAGVGCSAIAEDPATSGQAGLADASRQGPATSEPAAAAEPPAASEPRDYEAERARKLAYRASLTEEDIARMRKHEKPADYAFGRKVAMGVEGASLSGDPEERQRTALEIERDQRIEQAARVDDWQARLDGMSSDERVQATLDCLGRRPSFARVLRAVLEHCREERDSEEVEAFIEGLPDFAANRQSARRYVFFLMRTGALVEVGYDAEGNLVDERSVANVQEGLDPKPAPGQEGGDASEQDEADGEVLPDGTTRQDGSDDQGDPDGAAALDEAGGRGVPNVAAAQEGAGDWASLNGATRQNEADDQGILSAGQAVCCGASRADPGAAMTVPDDQADPDDQGVPPYGQPACPATSGAEAAAAPDASDTAAPERSAAPAAPAPADLIVAWRITTTPEGLKALESTDARTQLRELLASQVQDRYEAYLDVLTFCEEPRTLAQISEFLIGNPGLEIDDRGIVNMQPNAYIGKLDKAGALVWTGEGWQTAKEVLEVLEEC